MVHRGFALKIHLGMQPCLTVQLGQLPALVLDVGRVSLNRIYVCWLLIGGDAYVVIERGVLGCFVIKGPGLPSVLLEWVSYAAKQSGIPVAKLSLVLSCLTFQSNVLPHFCRWLYLPKLVGKPARGRRESPLPPHTPGSVFSLSSLHVGIPVQHHIVLQKIRFISSRHRVLNDGSVTFAFQKQIFVPIKQCKLQVTHSIY